jgi:chorismate synthase
MPDAAAAEKAGEYLAACAAECNSAGGIVECVVHGLPVGLGDPVFEKLDANLAKAIVSIGAVKGFELGDGFEAARATGLTNNDPFGLSEEGSVIKKTNHSGGTLGGMSDGSALILRAAFKPTPSISSSQQTVNRAHEEIDIQIKGRHDPVIVPRAVVVVESMTAITILDALLANMSARLDRIVKFYRD